MAKSTVKTCQNCTYRSGVFGEGGLCMLTGFACSTQRQHPTPLCDERFSGWVERQKSWIQWLLGL